MKKEISAVIFDIDDTLYDRNKAQAIILEQFKRQYAELFEPVDEYMLTTAFYEADRLSVEFYYADSQKESIREKRFEYFLDMIELDNSYANEMTEAYLKYYAEVNAPVEDAVEVVSKLNGTYKLGIITNGIADTQRAKLNTLGITDKFESLTISEENGCQKPESKIFWDCAKELGSEAKHCIYIGNSYNGDVVGANQAGMKACWFNPSKTHPIHMPVQPDYEIARLTDLFNFL